jgi:hypothetical protein
MQTRRSTANRRRDQINRMYLELLNRIELIVLPEGAQTKRILCRLPATNGETKQMRKDVLVVVAAVAHQT